MKQFYIIICFIVCFIGAVFSQDSLDVKFKNISEANKFDTLAKLAKLNWYSDSKLALIYSQKCLEIAEKNKDTTNIIKANIYIGIANNGLSNYKKALAYFLTANKLAKKINDEYGIGISLTNIALVYNYLGQYDKALEYNYKVKQLAEANNDSASIVTVFNNIGDIKLKQENYTEAIDFFKKAYRYSDSIKYHGIKPIILINLAEAFEKTNRLYLAKKHYNLALKCCKKQNSHALSAYALQKLANIYFVEKNYSQSINYIIASDSLCDSLNLFETQIHLYQLASMVYDSIGKYKTALHYKTKYIDAYKNLSKKKHHKQLTEMQVKFDTQQIEAKKKIFEKKYEAEKKIRHVFIISSLLIVLLFLIVIVLLYQKIKHKRKSLEKLNAKKQIIKNQQKELEKSFNELKISEKLYRTLIETSPDGMLITDLKGIIEFASPTLIEDYGYNAQKDVVGKRALNFVHKKDQKKIFDTFYDVIKNKTRKAIEIEGLKKDGSAFYLEVNITRITDEKDIAKNMLFVFRDITQRKKEQLEQLKQQETIFKQKQQINELEIQKKEQENKMLIDRINIQNRELTTKAMSVIKQNSYIHNLLEILMQLKTQAEQKQTIAPGIIQQLIIDLKMNLQHNTWSEFETHFTQVHQDFYKNILKAHPDLTQNERKLCAFLRLNLSTKEIAELTQKTPHSINVARTRLRQKLELTNSDMSLHDYLFDF